MGSRDLHFAERFARMAGDYMRDQRVSARATDKSDGTPVTEVDLHINKWFIDTVREHDRSARVQGEEQSAGATHARRVWVIDPVDGTAEYVRSIPDDKRTSCVGIALIVDGVTRIAAVYNPFQRTLLSASHQQMQSYLNGQRLRIRSTRPFRTRLPYDYCSWDTAPVDPSIMQSVMGHPHINAGSAIWQACQVAMGQSAFAIFPGQTVHDIAAPTLIVQMANGVVSNVRGGHDVLSGNGVIYAENPAIHQAVVWHMNSA